VRFNIRPNLLFYESSPAEGNNRYHITCPNFPFRHRYYIFHSANKILHNVSPWSRVAQRKLYNSDISSDDLMRALFGKAEKRKKRSELQSYINRFVVLLFIQISSSYRLDYSTAREHLREHHEFS
jgi:hypothetical protein